MKDEVTYKDHIVPIRMVESSKSLRAGHVIQGNKKGIYNFAGKTSTK